MTLKMCDKAYNTHPSTIEYVPDQFETQEICDKAVDNVLLYFILFHINIRLKKCVTELFLKILS